MSSIFRIKDAKNGESDRCEMFPNLFSYVLPTGIMRKINGNNNPAIEKHNHPEGKTC